MATSELPLVQCQGVTRRFQAVGETIHALESIDLDVDAGCFVAVSGPSGSGKSTLLALIGCLDRPTSGVVAVGGYELGSLRRRQRRQIRRRSIAHVLAAPADNLHLAHTVAANVSMTARGDAGAVAPDRVGDLLDQFGLGDLRDRRCAELSGGQQQRVAIACALAAAPLVLLADEPTGALDRETGEMVIDALARVVATGATVLAATHDPAVVAASERVVRLEHGRLLP